MTEWNNQLLPASVILRDLSGDHLSEPFDVPDLLLLELDICVENSILSITVERQGVSLALFIVHHVVQTVRGDVESVILATINVF